MQGQQAIIVTEYELQQMLAQAGKAAAQEVISSFKVTLLDVQQIHKTMRDTHFLLRDKSLEAAIKQKAKSGGVPEL